MNKRSFFNNQDMIYDKEIDKNAVICAQCAFSRCGLTTQDWVHLDLWTSFSEIDGVETGAVRYLYNPHIDFEYELTPMDTNPLLLLPSKERAIVEYIKCEKWCDEGTLIEGLKTYLYQFINMDKLYEVADHFELNREILDYWIKEAYEDEEV